MSRLYSFIFVLAFAPFIFVILDRALSKKFMVHEKGLVVVTGASSGIGKHAVEYLANTTKFTILVGVRKESDAIAIASMDNPSLIPLFVDVADHSSTERAVQRIHEIMISKSLPLVGLVNNAGIGRSLELEGHDLVDIRKVFDTNFFGAIDITQQLLPTLRKFEGRIVMMSSVAGKVARPLNGIYAASKFAMEAMTDSLRREIAHMGVSVSLVEPAFVKSEIFKKGAEHTQTTLEQGNSNEIHKLYDRFRTPEKLEAGKAKIAKAADPIVTSMAVHRALTDPLPEIRYPVANFDGIPAWVVTFVIPFIPDRVLDSILEKT